MIVAHWTLIAASALYILCCWVPRTFLGQKWEIQKVKHNQRLLWALQGGVTGSIFWLCIWGPVLSILCIGSKAGTSRNRGS